jgi:hypothetical protein
MAELALQLGQITILLRVMNSCFYTWRNFVRFLYLLTVQASYESAAILFFGDDARKSAMHWNPW